MNYTANQRQNELFAHIFTFYSCFILITGSIGNAMVILTIYHYKSLRSSSKFLFVQVAVSDMLALAFSWPRYHALIWKSTPPRNWSHLACIFMPYLYNFPICYAAWALVLQIMERFLLTKFPTSFAPHLHFRMAVGASTFVFLVMNIFYLFEFTREWDEEKKQCGASLIPYDVSVSLDLFTRINVPFFLLLGASGTTYYVLKKRMQRTGIIISEYEETKRILSATRMTLTIAIVQLILALPSMVYMFGINTVRLFHPPADQELIIFGGINMVMLTNHGINFYVYCITSQSFRTTFVNIFRKSTRKIVLKLRGESEF